MFKNAKERTGTEIVQENRWLRRECSLSMGHDATHANGAVHTTTGERWV